MKPRRMKPSARKTQLLDAAVQAAGKYGFHQFNRDHIAEFSGTSPTLITVYFKSVNKLKNAIMREALRREHLKIIAEGIVTGDPIAKKADRVLKKKALESIGV
jgi:AcrR family transcriptional regulator